MDDFLTSAPLAPSSPDMPISTGKRRTPAHPLTSSTSSSSKNALPYPAVMSTVMQDPPLLKTSAYPADDHRAAVNRRRRFILYTLAFATMLALSSVLDVRRASLRNRHAKLQLTLPSSSLSSLSDSESFDSPPASAPHDVSANPARQNNRPHAKPHAEPISVPVHPPRHPPANVHGANANAPDAPDTPSESAKRDVYLSQQELDDGVDQLIAHVDQENSVSSNGTSPSDSKSAQSPPIALNDRVVEGSAGEETAGVPLNSSSEDVRLNAEDYFNGAVKRMNDLIREDRSKSLIDENDLRTLQALELQATRGDCELKSGSSSGSLFKSDAEAASNVDIERTHPLWGAWCLFMRVYKTEAMRDYVTKQKVIEEKVETLQQNNQTLSNSTHNSSFDPNASSLDDVITPAQQTALRSQTELVVSHLQDNDMRYLAALSLQATFGDCGPYGRESVPDVKDGEEKIELRSLREPLLEQTVVRREGALWGAWCVMQGKKRTAAAANLTHRVDLLVDQLSKSQAAVLKDEESASLQQTDEKESGAHEKDVPTPVR